jgi:hypothetical protein
MPDKPTQAADTNRPCPNPPASLSRIKNPRLQQEMEQRRAGAQTNAGKVQTHVPRPLVRPTSPPQQVLPPAVSAAMARQAVSSAKTVGSVQKASSKPASAAALKKPVAAKPAAEKAAAPPVSVAAVHMVDLNTSSASQALASESLALQTTLSDLQSQSSYSDITADINRLDQKFESLAELLESARQEGYRFEGGMELKAFEAMSQWQHIRPEVEKTLVDQSRIFQGQINTLNLQVKDLDLKLSNQAVAAPLLKSARSTADAMLQNIQSVKSNLRTSYSPIDATLQEIERSLSRIHWGLDQLKEAKFKLDSGEDLVMAVPARWDKESKDDPEGILYITDHRLVFEQKEKVSTKKVLFISTASEMVQEVLIDQPVHAVLDWTAENKGLFGHQDFLMVRFKEAKFGSVAFHLNGQDSKDWAALLEKVRSNQIQAERYNASSTFSFQDLSRPLTTADVVLLQQQVNSLQDEMMLQANRQELADLENEVRLLERKLSGIRARGYEIEKNLEPDIMVLAVQWDRIKTNANHGMETLGTVLTEQMKAIQSSLTRFVSQSADLQKARPLYLQIKSGLASAEAQADAAQATVRLQYDEYADEVEFMSAHLEWIAWMLDALETATFQLLATECGVAAVEAVHMDRQEPLNGILFLTDQRILWEDRVDQFELQISVPIVQVGEVKKESDAVSGNDLLTFQFAAGAPLSSARYQLALPVADDWLQMVGRVRSGGYSRDRVTPISEQELQRIRNAPKQCSNCGAGFTAPLLRGQTQITCEYCGLVSQI